LEGLGRKECHPRVPFNDESGPLKSVPGILLRHVATTSSWIVTHVLDRQLKMSQNIIIPAVVEFRLFLYPLQT